jgi:NADH-quinone oxidoreductase subunit L
MGGLNKKIKITFITFLIGCIAIAGIPPFSGFFSKDAILLAAFEHDERGKILILYSISLFTALLTTYYMFRLLFITFTGKFRGTQEQEHHLHESPALMTIPLIILAVLAAIGGFVGIPEVFVKGGDKLTPFLSSVIATNHEPVSRSTEFFLMGLSGVLVVATIIFTGSDLKIISQRAKRIWKSIENKWYVDELYDKIIVNPLKACRISE